MFANGLQILAGVRKQPAKLPESIQQMVIGDMSVLKETSLALKYSLFEGVDTVIHTAARVHVMDNAVLTLYGSFVGSISVRLGFGSHGGRS